ncbi:MAG: crotonase/enoyl-CoA hydratase family protein [Syntrophomonadaceae bacterium]|nr:crotonase/enoyl-CoA hydratase family protein [Syntrophomonadaceae bacterium]
MSNNDFIVETRGNILLMGFNRPDKRNALTPDMFNVMARAYGELHNNPNLRCGLLYAVGDHFTSGLDLPQWSGRLGKRDWEPGMMDPYARTVEMTCKKPVVMACQGICYTIGVELLLASDVRIAARDVRFAFLEVKRGLFPLAGGTVRFFREIGWGHANRYILTGDELKGEEAYRLGLVQELVEPGQQFERALDIAERIAKAAPLGVQKALSTARIARDYGDVAAFSAIVEDTKIVTSSKDAQEGVMAFKERREPVFTGE